MTVIATWIDEPWRLPTAEGETDMADYKHRDIDGDRIEVQSRPDHDDDTKFWTVIRPRSGQNTAVWLSTAAAQELRDWLTEQLGDAVEADPVATQPMPPAQTPTEARTEAARTARNILASGGFLGNSNAVSAEEIIDLAEWILEGAE